MPRKKTKTKPNSDEVISHLRQLSEQYADTIEIIGCDFSEQAAIARGDAFSKYLTDWKDCCRENANTLADLFDKKGKAIAADYVRMFRRFDATDINLFLHRKKIVIPTNKEKLDLTHTYEIHPLLVMLHMYLGGKDKYSVSELSDLTKMSLNDVVDCCLEAPMYLIIGDMEHYVKTEKNGETFWSTAICFDPSAPSYLSLLEKEVGRDTLEAFVWKYTPPPRYEVKLNISEADESIKKIVNFVVDSVTERDD